MKIVIYLKTKVGQTLFEHHRALELSVDAFGDGEHDALERYGRSWAKLWPNDIVMFIEEEL